MKAEDKEKKQEKPEESEPVDEESSEKELEELVEAPEEEEETETAKEAPKDKAEEEAAEEKAAEATEEEKPAEEAKEAEEKAEEEKPGKKAKEEEEEEIVEERIYTVPLGKAWILPGRKRAPRAMRMLRSFIVKHMKLDVQKETEDEEEEEPGKLTISNEVNLRVWSRGIEKPPRKVRVRAAKDKDGNVTVYLAEAD
jgi:large subunit ribosomal protein L31e